MSTISPSPRVRTDSPAGCSPRPNTRTRAALGCGVLALLVLTGCGTSEFRPDGAETRPVEMAVPPPEAKKAELGKGLWLETQGDQRRVLIQATVCRREGPLEHLLTRNRIKDHEAILTTDADGKQIHGALIAAGARPGKPVQYVPTYRAATGQPIKVSLRYQSGGREATVPAQRWIKNMQTGEDLNSNWVFTGSFLLENPDGGPQRYAANLGDLICISNIETAMLDVPFKSTKDNPDLQWEANADRIPPLDTPVTVILEPVLGK